MLTCKVEYELDPLHIKSFEEYGLRWMELVPRFGGVHHGYFLPGESTTDRATALFSFSSIEAYARYRMDHMEHPGCVEAYNLAARTGCIKRMDRTLLRALLPTR